MKWLKILLFGYQYKDCALEAHPAEQRPCKAKVEGANPSRGSIVNPATGLPYPYEKWMDSITGIVPYDTPTLNVNQVFKNAVKAGMV